jgi:uncharacterized membrane protein
MSDHVSRSARAPVSFAILVGGTALIALADASAWLPGGAPTWGVWSMIVGSACVMAGMVGVGATRSRVRRPLVAVAVIFLLIVIVGGFGAALLLPPTSPEPLLFGLPRRAAIEIVGVGLLPLVILPGLFALEFCAGGLDEASLAAFRARCASLRDE